MFLYSKWMGLDLGIRQQIAAEFGIAKTAPTHVNDNKIISDGYKVEDVENALNIDALQQFLGSTETDMAVLWDLLIERFTPQPLQKLEVIEEVIIVGSVEESNAKPEHIRPPVAPEKPKRGRPKK